jgi:hypothetical protein
MGEIVLENSLFPVREEEKERTSERRDSSFASILYQDLNHSLADLGAPEPVLIRVRVALPNVLT